MNFSCCSKVFFERGEKKLLQIKLKKKNMWQERKYFVMKKTFLLASEIISVGDFRHVSMKSCGWIRAT